MSCNKKKFFYDPSCKEGKKYECRKYKKYLEDCRDALTASDVWFHYKDAVVTVTVFTQFLGEDDEPTYTFTEGSGFFVRSCGCHYIVTASHVVLLSDAARDTRDPPATADLVRGGRIFVTVYNVNGQGKSYVYEADLVGVDGAGDSAVLKIDHCKAWNTELPKVRSCQPYFKWGKSRDYFIGQTVYIVGQPVGSGIEDPQSISQGIVRDNRFVDSTGTAVFEGVSTDADIISGNSGGPMVDQYGHVIGIVSYVASGSSGDKFSVGVSQYFAQRVVQVIINGDKGPYKDHLALQVDSIGNFWRYMKGYLGFKWKTISAVDFLRTIDGTPGVFTFLYNSATGTDYKKIQGIIIEEVDGAVGSFSTGTPSPFLTVIEVGDFVTHINGCPIGQLPPQIVYTVITWYLLAGCPVCLTYRKRTENFATSYSANANLAEFPAEIDYALDEAASYIEDPMANTKFFDKTGKELLRADGELKTKFTRGKGKAMQ